MIFGIHVSTILFGLGFLSFFMLLVGLFFSMHLHNNPHKKAKWSPRVMKLMVISVAGSYIFPFAGFLAYRVFENHPGIRMTKKSYPHLKSFQ